MSPARTQLHLGAHSGHFTNTQLNPRLCLHFTKVAVRLMKAFALYHRAELDTRGSWDFSLCPSRAHGLNHSPPALCLSWGSKQEGDTHLSFPGGGDSGTQKSRE